MTAKVYIEGGGDSKELHIRCRKGFRQLLERCGFAGRLPRLFACGGRSSAFDDFKTAHRGAGDSAFVALLVDSEDPVKDVDQPWAHLKTRDNWDRPAGAHDDQALLMTTCMETWIVADRATLQAHYGADLLESALPPLDNLESRDRAAIQDALQRATRQCANAYQKGKRSFEVVGKLEPQRLEQHLPSFARAKGILDRRL